MCVKHVCGHVYIGQVVYIWQCSTHHKCKQDACVRIVNASLAAQILALRYCIIIELIIIVVTAPLPPTMPIDEILVDIVDGRIIYSGGSH